MEYLIIDEFGIPVAQFRNEMDRDKCFKEVFEIEDLEYKKMNGDEIIDEDENNNK